MDTKGFFASLYDFSFSSLITLKIIKALYIFLVGASVLFAVISVVTAFSNSAGSGLLTLILAPVGVVLASIWIRLSLEFTVAVFRILDNSSEIAAQGRGGAPAAPAAPTQPSAPTA